MATRPSHLKWLKIFTKGIVALFGFAGLPHAEESHLVVSKISKPNTVISERHRLASLPIWRDEKSEWLTYSVQAPSRGYTLEGQANLIVRPLPNGKKIKAMQLESSRLVQGEVGLIYHQNELRWSLATDQIEDARFIRGQLPGGVYARKVIKGNEGYHWSETLNEVPGESKEGDFKAPLLFEESLFLEVRDWPLEKGYVKEIWWYPLITNEHPPKEAVYARAEVLGGQQTLRDIQVWQVRIKPASGRSSEVFIQCQGSHPVIEANLSDGSKWILQTVSRR